MRSYLTPAFSLLCVLALAGPAPAQRVKAASGASLDEEVQKAIEKGVAHIWSLQKPDGSWGTFPHSIPFTAGPTALALYPLLESGVSATDERMVKALDWLAKNNDQMTYSLGLRCQVWLIANRQTKNKYIKEFEADVKRLLAAGPDGRYSYDSNAPDKKELKAREDGGGYDNSNSQFGLLGVWAGARANMEFIPDTYWHNTMKHWIECKNLDGGIGYRRNAETTPSMTAAGVASILVCMDNSLGDAFASCEVGQSQEFKAVNSALTWLEQGFDTNLTAGPYYLYALERVGLASGFKYFGSSDWYKLGADYLIRTQQADGSWSAYGPEVTGTVWGVLFLVRGRNPIMFNRLQYNGDWNNRPRALASLTEWSSKNFEGTVNWQIINLKVPVSEWHDAPILFISGAKAPTFSEEEMGKLRAYIQQGGTIFSVAECGGSGKAFSKAMRETYAKLFPDYEMKAVDKDHELYSTAVQFPLKTKPHFFMLSNGIRPLAIHAEEDMVLPWQVKSSSTEAWAYQGAANVYLYVTDKGSLKEGSVKARGVNHWPAEPNFAPPKAVKLARLKYGGNWDPEPLAYERFGRMLAEPNGPKGTGVGIGLEVTTTEIKDVAGSGAAVATLTGTGAFTLGAEDKDALKKFVEGGGLLVIDAAGGSRTFAEAAEGAIQDIFGVGALKRLDLSSPIYTAKEIKEYRFRRATRARLGGEKNPQMRGVMVVSASAGATSAAPGGQRLGVIYSREDLTGGLVGYSSFGCDGYAPQTAYEIMRNAMLLASGQASAAPATPPATPEAK